MNGYVLGFQDIDKSKLPVVGGKGANLGELSKISGIRVPDGFCVTTSAYKKMIDGSRDLSEFMEQLSLLKVSDKEKINELSGKIRCVIEASAMDKEIENEIIRHLQRLGEDRAYAVRSSATAEDLPLSSFAGQQDTYLNIRGRESILHNVRKCWASLFTERAVTYRIQNNFDHKSVYLSVVIQRMVFPQAAGIMFTADPITSNRKIVSIDAGFGLGEAMVSGLATPDIYKVRDGKILDKKVSAQKLAVYALENGGTEERELEPGEQTKQTLTDSQIIELSGMGRRIEAHFGCPQDIEWCLFEGQFFVVQSRPITTLYPVPVSNDGKNHVYISYGHRQMMTDAFKPLGISFFKILDEWLGRPEMRVAGGRFYKDMSHELTSPVACKIAIKGFAMVDVLMQNALKNVLKRKDFIKTLARGKASVMNFGKGGALPMFNQFMKLYRENDAAVVPALIKKNEASVESLRQNISKKSGVAVLDFIIQDHKELTDIMFEPKSVAAAFLGIYASNWLNKNIEKWLGEKNTADILAQSAANNIVSEMGLDLLDVSDAIRKYPEVIAYLEHSDDTSFFKDLLRLEGGAAVSGVFQTYLSKYGMHCSGDIDITRPRWNEKPSQLIPMILGNIKNFEPGEHIAKSERGKLESQEKAEELLTRLKKLSGGSSKARKAKKMISVLRNFIGYREYSKHACLQRYYLYKQAMLNESEKLVQKGLIRHKEDIFYLYFDELKEVIKTNRLDYGRITQRKDEHEVNMKLTPPRVMTSEGEVISGEYDTGKMPKGALAGTPVSSGVVEGRARVVMKLEDAHIEDGDILVTVFTDPSWSTLFVSVKGVVMEVGGMMTHGAVIAREYGLPSVVGVENATTRIKDGQMIRVNGTQGYVEIL